MREILGLLYYGCRKCQGLFPNVCELSEHMCKCTGVKVLQTGVHQYAYESSHLKKFLECCDTCSHTEACPFQNYKSGTTMPLKMATTTFFIESDTLEQNGQGELADCTTVVIQSPNQEVKAPEAVDMGNGHLDIFASAMQEPLLTLDGQDPTTANDTLCMTNDVSFNTEENCFPTSGTQNLQGCIGDPFVASEPGTNDLVQAAGETAPLQGLRCSESWSADNIVSVSTVLSREQEIAAAVASRKVVLMEGIRGLTYIFTCNDCGFKSPNIGSFIQHRQIKHHGRREASEPLPQPGEAPSSVTQKPYKCAFCSQRFPTKARYTRHVLTHTDKLFCCSKCKYSCGSQQQLTKHEEEHSAEVLRSEVEHANRRLTRERAPCKEVSTNATDDELKAHIASHKRGTRYACNECDFRCSQRSAMTSHIMDHRGMKGWQCLACGFMGGRKSDVTRHVLKRHKEYTNVNDGLVNLGTKLNLNIDQYRVEQKRTKGKPQPSESKVRVQSERSNGKHSSSPSPPESKGEAASDTTAQPSKEDNFAIDDISDLQFVSQSDNIDMEYMLNPNSEINIQDLLALECHINIDEGLGAYDIQPAPMEIPWPIGFGDVGEIMGDEEVMENQDDDQIKLIGDSL